MNSERSGSASEKLGLKPGSVVYTGQERTEDVQFEIIDYTESEFAEKRVTSPQECFPYRDSASVSWINVRGIHQSDYVESLGTHFGIEPLSLEDIVNTGHRPKMDETEGNICLIVKMLYHDDSGESVISEQVSVVFGRNWVISFQETKIDVFEAVRKRIRQTVPRVRFLSSDYLAYTLIDAIVDHYFVVLEATGEEIEALDDAVSEDPKPEQLGAIRSLKKRLIDMRKAVWPMREVVSGLERCESSLVKSEMRPYLRDLYEHTVQVIDTVETFRDMVSGLLDLYHTGVANRMNDIMKVLTIFATLFIPLGFLAGVYGMNFDTSASPFNLPELGFRYGYPLFWGLVIMVAGALLWFFRDKKWL